MEGDVLAFAQVMTVIVTSIAAIVGIGLGGWVLLRRTLPRQPSIGAPARDEEHQRHLEASIEAIAIEVERISEAQRFMVGLLSDPAALRRPERAELAPPDARGRVNTPH
jgi:hypothetical protein